MRTWNLKSEDPLALTLAADARLVPTDYLNDHIWDLTLTGGDPPAIALQTTFGLRARNFRLFPRFGEASVVLSDPAGFNRSPVVQCFSPNFVRLVFSPFAEIEVMAEYWVPDSHAIAGRLTISNQGKLSRTILFDWAAVLNPSSDGQRLSPLEMGAGMVLAGRTGGLAPVIFLTGGAEPVTSPYPALELKLELPVEGIQTLTWVAASLDDPKASFNHIQQIVARNWDAEIARIELLNAGLIDIYTGNPEWDAVFALSQKVAYSLFCGPTTSLPAPSFVLTRQPDSGFSPRGDGSDYNHLWNGQSVVDAFYLSGVILPAASHLIQGLLRNYLASQNQAGAIDGKPGLGGQRSQLFPTPLLVNLTWNLYEVDQDLAFLEDIFPTLLANYLTWFTPEHDRDGDGIPEWDNVLQTGFEDHPLFAHWHSWARSIDITTVESPTLCAFLYAECLTLIRMAKLLERNEPLLALQAHADNLKAAVELAWDSRKAVYHCWDRDTHRSPSGEVLGERYGSGEILIRRDFDQPVRVVVKIHTLGDSRRHAQVILEGRDSAAQPLSEPIPEDHLRWYLGLGSVTSEKVFNHLEKIEISGVDDPDRITLQVAGFDWPDQTVLLPLWAGIPDRERAQELVNRTVTADQVFWQPYGIQACATNLTPDESQTTCQSVHLFWNWLIGSGLVEYGYRQEAADLVTRLMEAVIFNLKRDKVFRRLYDARTGVGSGDRNALGGLAPLGLFLDTLGVKIFSPTRVEVSGFNPFSWPVTVKYRGLTILRQGEKTNIIFPDGQTVTLDGSETRLVTLEQQEV